MTQKRILLIVGGGIAAYKSAELIRLIRKAGYGVRCVLTKGGAQFVTPLTLGALSEDKVYADLFDLKDEAEMGHILLSRQADLVVVCPICWRRCTLALPTIWLRRCCSQPTSRCWPCPQ